MLVLTRRLDENIIFPALGITVKVLRIGSGKVRVGIDAPSEVQVLRSELKQHGRRHDPAGRGSSGEASESLAEMIARSLAKLEQSVDDAPVSEELVLGVIEELKAADDGASDHQAGRPIRALLVDDNRNESKLLAGYLRLREIDVVVADDGAAALDYLSQNEQPDFVLLDMQMPGMDGATMLDRVRSQERHEGLKVFAVSGSDPADYGVDVGGRGVNGWFPKPVDPEDLVFRIVGGDESGNFESREVAACR